MDPNAVAATFAIAALAVAGVLWSEARLPRLEWLFKPLAALCFLALALQAGALESRYGEILFLGLLLCFAGDVLLIPDSDRTFLLGLTSFLLGHLAYLFAFTGLPRSSSGLIVSVLPVLVLAVLSLRWLWPRLAPRMRLPVVAYIVVICAMLLGAGAAWGSSAGAWIVAGAWGFALSDLAVARNQFIRRAMLNRLWGLPLYFASQLTLAYSIARLGTPPV